MHKKWALLVVLLTMVVFCGTVAAAEGMAYREYPISATVVVSGDGSASVSESVDVKKGDYFKVVLYAAGGTGYEWTLATQNPLLVEAVGNSTAPVDNTGKLAGGKVRWVFYLKMKADATGQETLQFVLRRSWEKNVQPARSFDLTLVAR